MRRRRLPHRSELFTVSEAAAVLAVDIATVRRWCAAGRWRCFRAGFGPGGGWRIPRRELEKLTRLPEQRRA